MTFQANLQYTVEDMLHYARVHRRSYQKFMLVFRPLLLLIILGAAAYLLMMAFRYERVNYTILIYEIIVAAYAVFYCLSDRIRARAVLKAREKTYGETTLVFDEEGVSSQSANSQSQYRYPAFTELFYSRKYETYYLYINKHEAVVVPEHCFTQGDPAAFGIFISGKTGLEVKEIK